MEWKAHVATGATEPPGGLTAAVCDDPGARRCADVVGPPPRPARAQLLGDVETGRKRILVKAVAAVAAAEEGITHTLNLVQVPLSADSAASYIG